MAGDIFSKERAIVTITSTGASATTASAVSAGADFDCRSGGGNPEDLEARFELTCQWATVTGIVAQTVVAEFYLLPKLDGTNLPDIDATGGASVLPASLYVSSFVATKTPTATTNARFQTGSILLFPTLYTPYILNRSGQTITANWTLKAVSARMQYT